MRNIMHDSSTGEIMSIPKLSERSRTGAMVRGMRVGVQLSQRELAQRIGCSHQHLSRIENGTRDIYPDFGLGLRISQAIADRLTEAWS